MFKIELYKEFLDKNIENTYNKKDLYLNALLQFDKAPGTYMGVHDCSRGYRVMFKKLLINKPKSAWVNRYLLFLFGFKYCSKCNNVKSVSDFYLSTTFWDKLSCVCSECAKTANKKYNKSKVVFIENSKEFILDDWKNFLLSKVVNSNVERFDEIIDSLLQFGTSQYKILKISDSDMSHIFKRVFGDNYKNKPIGATVQNYFLYEFGFKYCPYMKKVLEINQFRKSKATWNNLNSHCREAERIQQRERRKNRNILDFVESNPDIQKATIPGYENELKDIYEKRDFLQKLQV